MRPRHVGYPCVNHTLGVTTDPALRLAGLTVPRFEQAVAASLEALGAMLTFADEHELRLLRVGQSLVPFASHPELPEACAQWRERHAAELESLRARAERLGVRLTMHAGAHTVLDSPDERVVLAAIAELSYSAEVLTALGGPDSVIVLGIGGIFGDRAAAAQRFVRTVRALPGNVRARLALEHDAQLWSLREVLTIARHLELPVVFDLLAQRCLPGAREDWRDGLVDDLRQAMATWGRRVPELHLASQQPDAQLGRRADYVAAADLDALLALMARVGAADAPFDLMIEAGASDRAALAVRQRLAARS